MILRHPKLYWSKVKICGPNSNTNVGMIQFSIFRLSHFQHCPIFVLAFSSLNFLRKYMNSYENPCVFFIQMSLFPLHPSLFLPFFLFIQFYSISLKMMKRFSSSCVWLPFLSFLAMSLLEQTNLSDYTQSIQRIYWEASGWCWAQLGSARLGPSWLGTARAVWL